MGVKHLFPAGIADGLNAAISDGTIVRSRNSCINDSIRSTSSFKREMARVEKMELCTGNISFKDFSTLHRKGSIVFCPK
jgi:hypothetical protein